MLRKMLVIIGLLGVASLAIAGTWTPNNFLYKPSTGARGEAEKKVFENGLDKVDVRLGKEIWVGDPGRGATLQSAVSSVGGNQAILRIPTGTWSIGANLTIPANVCLKPERGAILSIANGVTLTINGGFEAGLYNVFTCTGTGKVVFGAGAVKEVYIEWWGAKADGNTNCSGTFQQALNSLPPGGVVRLLTGRYKLSTTPTQVTGTGVSEIVWPAVNNLSIQGAGMGLTDVWLNFGSNSEQQNFCWVNGSSSPITGVTLKGFSLHGTADQAAVPAYGVMLLDHVHYFTLNDVEMYWLRGSAVRFNRNTSDDSHDYIISDNYFHDIITANMTVDGAAAGIVLGFVSNLDIRNNRFINCWTNGTSNNYAVYAYGPNIKIVGNYVNMICGIIVVYSQSINALIDRNTVVSGAISAASAAKNVTISNNNIRNGGIYTYGLINYAITGNTIYSPDVSPGTPNHFNVFGYISYGGTDGTISGNTIYGKSLTDGSAYVGLWAGDATTSINHTITGNTITNCEIGIKISRGDHQLIANNTLIGSGSADGSSYGIIIVTGVVDNIRIIDNKLQGYSKALVMSSNSTNIEFSKNRLKDVMYLTYIAPDPATGPIICDSNESLDSVLAAPWYSTLAPSATRNLIINNTQRWTDTPTVTLANSATPSVGFGKDFTTGGTTTITNLTKGGIGQTITILSAHSVTISHNANANDGYILLSGGADFGMVAGDTLTLHMFTRGVWQEIGRKH